VSCSSVSVDRVAAVGGVVAQTSAPHESQQLLAPLKVSCGLIVFNILYNCSPLCSDTDTSCRPILSYILRKRVVHPAYACSDKLLNSLDWEAIIVPDRMIWSWYTGGWWVCCYIWYSKEGTRWGSGSAYPQMAGSGWVGLGAWFCASMGIIVCLL